MIPSDWIAGIIAREIDEVGRPVFLAALSNLDESIFGVQDLDRMAAAMVILFVEGVELDFILDEAQSDWRDLLMDAGLEDPNNWPIVVTERFGVSR